MIHKVPPFTNVLLPITMRTGGSAQALNSGLRGFGEEKQICLHYVVNKQICVSSPKPLKPELNACDPYKMGNAGSTGPADMESAEAKYIQQTVKDNCVVIFSKSYCPYCDTADKIFKILRVPALKIELDDRKDGDKMQNILGHMTDAYTVPRVFVNGKCVGGASETQQLHRKGLLAELVKQCRTCQ